MIRRLTIKATAQTRHAKAERNMKRASKVRVNSQPIGNAGVDLESGDVARYRGSQMVPSAP